MQKIEEDIITAVRRIGGHASRGEAKNRPVGWQPIQGATPDAKEATSPTRQSSLPSLYSKSSSSLEESEETEGLEDSYYMTDDYYSDELGYDSDMFRKYWEDDF